MDKGGYDYDGKKNDSVNDSQIVKHGIDINHVNMYNEFSFCFLMKALHYAVRRNHIELVKFLCSLKDINLTIVNLRGQSILDIAAFHQYDIIVQYLKGLGIEALLDAARAETDISNASKRIV